MTESWDLGQFGLGPIGTRTLGQDPHRGPEHPGTRDPDPGTRTRGHPDPGTRARGPRPGDLGLESRMHIFASGVFDVHCIS